MTMTGAHLSNLVMQALRLAGYALIFLAGIWFHSSGAMAAMAERPELAGRAILLVAIPETLVILGFAVAAMAILLLGGG